MRAPVGDPFSGCPKFQLRSAREVLETRNPKLSWSIAQKTDVSGQQDEDGLRDLLRSFYAVEVDVSAWDTNRPSGS